MQQPEKIIKLGEWTKIVRFRQSGATYHQKDLYLVHKTLGKKLRSTRDLALHIREHNLFTVVDPYLVNFEKPLQEGEIPIR